MMLRRTFSLERGPRRLRNLAVFLGSLALATFFSVAAHETDHPVTAANVFIVTVLINGSIGGLTQGLVTAVIVSIIYDFFIRFPVYERGFNAIDDLLPIVALTLTALISGAVSGQLRSKVASTERSRARLRTLLGYSSRLQRTLSLEEIARELAMAISDRAILTYCLDCLRIEHRFRDLARWEAALAACMADPPSGPPPQEVPALGNAAQTIDARAIIALTIIAIERCELLEDKALADAAIRSQALKNALLSSVSHDLRTPLAAIATSASNLDRLGDTLDEAGRRQMLDTIQQQCERLANFTTQLLSLGRLEGGLSRDELEIVDLEEAVGAAIAAIRPSAAERQIVRRIAAGPFFTRASPILLEQALFNLLDNALRYSPADRPVTISLHHEAGQVVIGIDDEGDGIAAGDLPHIFERFYRGRNRSGQPGHGLGLSIVKAFADAMEGTIEVVSPTEARGGTRVRILLPALHVTIEPMETAHG